MGEQQPTLLEAQSQVLILYLKQLYCLARLDHFDVSKKFYILNRQNSHFSAHINGPTSSNTNSSIDTASYIILGQEHFNTE